VKYSLPKLLFGHGIGTYTGRKRWTFLSLYCHMKISYKMA